MTDWLANISIGYVIAAIIVLLIARLIFGKYEGAAAKSAAEVSESALIAIALVFLIIRPFIMQAFYIPSGSMRPTLMERDHILVNKFIYRLHEPRRGDIIVFKSPPGASLDGEERDFVKRLIGVPGDTIEVKDGAVYWNNQRLKEPYILQTPDYEMPPMNVPSGKLFVMGDNRRNSNDSHAWGMLDRKRVIGEAIFRFWPLNRFGLIGRQ